MPVKGLSDCLTMGVTVTVVTVIKKGIRYYIIFFSVIVFFCMKIPDICLQMSGICCIFAVENKNGREA